jgi:small-conductance mechanosensitive channel
MKRLWNSPKAGALNSILLLIILASWAAAPAVARAQELPIGTPTPTSEEQPPVAPESVDVQPTARDEQIRARLQSILEATGWFVNPQVEVREGVVFLRGQAENAEFKTWAGDLARRTQDVTAVVNKMEVTEPSIWDFQPVLNGLREQGRTVVRTAPIIVFGLLVLLISWAAARLASGAARNSLRRRQWSPLLADLAARGAGFVIVLVGLYIIFQVAGLTSIALTVLGGTGLLGLILGIAFQNITENYLAGIFLSIANPFESGDLVEIAGILGYVQRLTTRATILMTLDGNHVQIPNATVYKSTIHNYTSNPNRRIDFVVGIGYGDSVSAAQEMALKVLQDHPAVLDDPEPWVLVESLGASTVNLRVFFWLDGTQYSWQKVRSSLIRLVKGAFQNAGIAMPGETRELILPDRIPIELYRAARAERQAPPAHPPAVEVAEESETVSTNAEGGLHSEAQDIEEQARRARMPEEGEDLLKPADD